MTYNIDMNIAEYEYTTSDIEYESDSNDSTEYTERMTKLADEQHAMETARLKAEEIARLKTELNVDRFLTWTRPQSTTVTTPATLSFANIIADQQTDDTWQSATKKKLKSHSDKTPKKQELCRSLGNIQCKCKYKVCNYAHSIDELYIKDCKHGRECRSIVYNYTTRVYTNKTNKTNDKYKIRKCSHIHPSETLENLEARLIKKPVTEEEMDLDWIAIQDFDAKHPSGFGKKSFVNPATNNLISCVSVEYLLKKKKDNQGSTYAYNKPFVYKPPVNRFVYTNKQTVAIDPKAKTEQQIKKNHETVASNLDAIKKNSLLIARFEVRTDNKMCQEKVAELKLQNDALVRDNENLTVYTTKLQALLEKKSAETPKKIPIAQTIHTLELPTRQVTKIDESKSKASSLVSWRKSYRMAVAPVAHVAHVALVASVSTPFADREERHTEKKEKKEKQTTQSHVAQTTTDDVREVYRTVPEHSSTSIKRDLCKSVIGGYKCPVGSDCRFAHSLDDLNITKCTFGTRCYDVVYASDGKVTNANGERTRVCQRLHPNESIQNVRSRLKMYDVPVVKAVKAVKTVKAVESVKSFKDAEVVKSIKGIAPVVEMVEMVEVFPCAPPPSPMVDFEIDEVEMVEVFPCAPPPSPMVDFEIDEETPPLKHQQEGGWTTVKQRQRVQHVKPVARAITRVNTKANTSTNANRNTPSNTKTEMCRLGAKCTRPTCYFAHSAKELNVTDCVFGDRCRLATRSANIGVYHDTSGIKCSRLHPGETRKSLYDRLKL
jgi:hypothetical protein